MQKIRLLLIILSLALISGINAQTNGVSKQWFMYRGFYADGFLDNANLPESWDAETGQNIAWNTKIPGTGHSCPVIWDNKVFVTTAISEAEQGEIKTGIYGAIEPVQDSSVHEWKIFCLDKQNGKIIWEKVSNKGIPAQKRHPMSSHANCTPATNGEYVVAFFGSEGLYCYNMDGKLQWKKDFGVLRAVFFMVESAEWEFASSPLIHENVVIIQCDVMENSFLAAFDIKTGNELWRKSRNEYPGWCTPNIYFDSGKARIAVNGFKHRGGYDFITGEEIWKMEGGGDIQIPTPVVSENLVYFNSAHGKFSPVMAVKTNASGTIQLPQKDTTDAGYLQWIKMRGGSYMGTMLLYRGILYNAAWNGKLICYDAQTGKEFYAEKVGKGNSYTASPVAADGIIYITDNDGIVYRVQAGPEYKLLSENRLNEVCMSTPAISKDYLIYRTQNGVIAISRK